MAKVGLLENVKYIVLTFNYLPYFPSVKYISRRSPFSDFMGLVTCNECSNAYVYTNCAKTTQKFPNLEMS